MMRVSVAIGTVAVLACLAFALLWQRADARADRLATELRAANATAALHERRAGELERAALRRMADDRAVDQLGKDMHDAIKDIPAGTAPGPAAVALGCQRLRAAGTTTSDAYQRICGGR